MLLTGAQLLTMVALVLVDQYRKQFRAPASFPRHEVTTMVTGDCEVRVYCYGQDLYDDMLVAIRGARSRILLETFIWKDDPVGETFKQALQEAADRGVEVYVAYDVFANLVVRRAFFRFGPGIEVLGHPLTRISRNHNKLLVVDGEVGFVGGYNIGELYATDWRDTHCRVTGDIVADLENAFLDYWNSMRTPGLPDVRRHGWLSPVRLYRNVPSAMHYPIRAMYMEGIDRAQESLWLTHAYFLPDDSFTKTLVDAARRGVDVRLIVPAQSNHVVADWLSRSFYDRLLAEGVRLFLYQGAMVHAKTAVVDGSWSTIGTANLDRLSLVGNYELNLEIVDPGVADRMREIFAADLENCVEVDRERWGRRSLPSRACEALLKPLRPLF